tara:strand:+ start:415 stop:654 length:240 start_codon:yes stop_codon:yes gene_type:complete
MDNIIFTLQEALSEQNGVSFNAKDGSDIHITLEDACNLVAVHDTLTEDNQVKMRSLLETSEDDYKKVLNFCNSQFNEEE